MGAQFEHDRDQGNREKEQEATKHAEVAKKITSCIEDLGKAVKAQEARLTEAQNKLSKKTTKKKTALLSARAKIESACKEMTAAFEEERNASEELTRTNAKTVATRVEVAGKTEALKRSAGNHRKMVTLSEEMKGVQNKWANVLHVAYSFMEHKTEETVEALCAKLPLYKYQYKDLAEAAMKAIGQQKRELQSAQEQTICRYQQETEQLKTLQYSGVDKQEFAELVENHRRRGEALQYQDRALKALEKQLAKVMEGTLRFDQKAQNIVQASGTGDSDTLCCKQDVSDWVSDFFFNKPEPDVDVVSMFRASDRALMDNLDSSNE